MQPAAGWPRPSPSVMPRQRTVPPATAGQPRGLHFSQDVPHHGHHDALYYGDTGVLCSIARDETACYWFKQHYAGTLCTTDVVVDEIRNRAQRSVGPDGQLMKLAAGAAMRRLVEVNPPVLRIDTFDSDDDVKLFDMIVQQLIGMAPQRATEDDGQVDDKHAGEASVIVRCKRRMAEGSAVIFLTNDSDAATVAAAHGITVRHYGHALHELVCAGMVAADSAWKLYSSATNVSGIPKAARFQTESEFVCSRTDGGCAACELLRMREAR